MKAHARAYAFGKGEDPEAVKRKLVSANPGSLVQVVRAGGTKNEMLVEMLCAQTLRAESSGSLLAKRPEIDLLLRLAGTTQIARAIKSHGFASGEAFLAINAGRVEVVVPEGFSAAELPRKKLTKQELGRVEIAALLDAKSA